jgi:hypothetical protein
LGKKAEVDYVARCNVVSRDHILRMDCELYNSETSALIGPFNSFRENPTTIYELIAIVEKEAPDMFRKIPGASSGGIGTPSFAAGISGLETATGNALDFETRYLVNLTTEPSNAALSFNGLPIASCGQSPCRAELPEGRVRIIAALEQYDTADTTVSITRNNQNVNIRLKANFGVLEIKPAYSDGMGSNEQWNLTINDKAFSFLENRLSPNKYKVKLSHRCYEDISFDVGINRDSREFFDITKHINPKQGGLDLSTERDGEPSSESVFVNGKRVGETPFSGSVPVCSEIELGKERSNVYVRLERGQTVRRVHKMPDSQEWLNKIAEEQRRAAETAEERRKREAIEQRIREIAEREAEQERKEMQPIRFGWRIMGGITATPGGSSSEWFDKTYGIYEDIGKGNWHHGGIFTFGLTLNIWPTNIMALVSELNYNFFSSNYCYGEKHWNNCEDDKIIWATLYTNTVSVPVLLRFGKRKGNNYFEMGYQWGFPFHSSMWIRGEVSDEKNFSDHRLKMDQAIILGFRLPDNNTTSVAGGFRFIYNWTKMDRYGTLSGPFAIGFTMATPF